MWLASLIVSFAIPSILLGSVVDDEREFEDAVRHQELAEHQWSSFHARHHRLRHHHRHKRHHHHHRHRRKPFLHHRESALLLQDPAKTGHGAPPGVAKEKDLSSDLLPDRNPAVEAKLEYMDPAMQDLKAKQQVAEQVRSNYENEVKAAMHHANEAQAIKINIARTELAIEEEDKKLARLAEDRLRLDRSHHHLVSSLHSIMDPKVEFVETRLKVKQQELKNKENKATQWNAKKDQFHTAATATIDERRASMQNLQAAEAAEERAHQQRQLAENHLNDVKKNVNFNVVGYRFSLAKARAAESDEERAEESTREAKVALKRLTGIMNMEQRRVDESMAIGKDRVQGKIRELEGVKKQSSAHLSQLMQEFKQWEDAQKTYKQHLEATQRLTKAAAQTYADHQEAVLNAANAKVVADAQGDTSYASDDNSDWAKDE